MGLIRDIANYIVISLTALVFFILFWVMVKEYIAELAVYLYKYETILVSLSIIFVILAITNVLNLEPINFLLQPVYWIKKRIKKLIV